MRFKIASLALTFAAACSGQAVAQPAYTAEEIVQMFIKSADLGKARAICIGSAEECAAKNDAPVEPVNMQVNFEYNSDVLTPEARETLAEFAKGLNDPRLEVATLMLRATRTPMAATISTWTCRRAARRSCPRRSLRSALTPPASAPPEWASQNPPPLIRSIR